MKKVLLSFLFFCTISINAATLLYRQGFDASQAQNKQACLAWDLNDVVFEKQIAPSKLIKHIHREQGLLKAPKIALKFYKLWRKKKKLKKQGNPVGLSWDGIFTRYSANDPKLIAFLRNFVMQINVLDTPMVKLMKELSSNGHTHGVLSNMGQNMLNVQINHLKTLPTSDHGLKIFFLDFLQYDKHNVIASPENNWLTKPNPKMYKLFLEKNKDRGQMTIFIDDKLENIEAALKNGFDVGIYYPTGSTSSQLKKLLHTELNIAH